MRRTTFLFALPLATGCFAPSSDDDTSTASATQSESDDDASATDAATDTVDDDDDASTDDDDAPSSTDAMPDDGSGDGTTSMGIDDTDDTGDASDGDTSDDGTSDDESTTGSGTPVETRTVFVTSFEHSLDIFAITPPCDSAAESAGLTGTYLHWRSTDAFEPATDFTHFDGPYVLVDGTVVAEDWGDLIDGILAHAIDLDENGSPVDSTAVWTNTADDGTIIVHGSTNQNCSSFGSYSDLMTARIGRASAADDGWTDDGTQSCALSARYYCFEQ